MCHWLNTANPHRRLYVVYKYAVCNHHLSDNENNSFSHLVTEENPSNSAKAAEMREMAMSLLARKEALMDKLKEKSEELQLLCIQEAVSY